MKKNLLLMFILIASSCTSLSPKKRLDVSKDAISKAMIEIEKGNDLKAIKHLKSSTYFSCQATICLSYVDKRDEQIHEDKFNNSRYPGGEDIDELVLYMKSLNKCSKETLSDRNAITECINKEFYTFYEKRGDFGPRGRKTEEVNSEAKDKYYYITSNTFGSHNKATFNAIYFLLDNVDWEGIKIINSALSKKRR